MGSKKNKNDTRIVLKMESELTIYQAEALKKTLLAALDQPEIIEIDLSAVCEIDTAGIQLLLLAKKTAMAQKKEIHFVAHSSAVLEVFELLDLATYFGDPLILPFRSENTSAR
ncbi:MAG: STAS domain-containing protein [Pseudomonadota bacterium]